jgi:hypothetical protein
MLKDLFFPLGKMSCTSQVNEFLEVICVRLKSKYRSRCTKVPQNVFVTICALLVSRMKRHFSSVHREFVIGNTVCIAALVPGTAKENSKNELCAF